MAPNMKKNQQNSEKPSSTNSSISLVTMNHEEFSVHGFKGAIDKNIFEVLILPFIVH